MCLTISEEDFKKMVEKECTKITGLSVEDFPNVYWEDYWHENLTIKEAKKCLEDYINQILQDSS
jgi:hypothetical protein